MNKYISTDRKIDKFTKIFTTYVLLLPALTIYATPIPSVSFGEAGMLFLMCLLLADVIFRKRTLKINYFWYYLLYAFFSSILISCLLSILFVQYRLTDMFQRIFRDGFYFTIVFIFGSWYFDFAYGKKVIRKISIVLGVFMLLQFVSYSVLHVYIPGIIPQLRTTISGGITGAELAARYKLTASYDGYIRTPGFFSEPAVCAQFMTVALLLELFPGRKKINFKLALFYSFSLLFTFSVNAYVAVAICWGLWTIYCNRKNKSNLIKIALMFAALCVSLIFVMSNGATASVINRLFELQRGGSTSGSSVIRVIRGMAFFFNMPIFYQIFGSGFGNFVQFKEAYNITTIYESADEYMNTSAYILVSTGIIGFILYIIFLLYQTKGRLVFSKMLLILILVFGLSSSIYSSAQFVIMLLFLVNTPKKGEIYAN